MAALSERRPDTVLALRQVRAEQLESLFEEEVAAWKNGLDWDFRPSAELVRRFAGMQALDGFVLIAGGEVAGFTYSVAEEGKGLIGDLYVSPRYRTQEREDALLSAIIDSMWLTPGMRRIEAQLMMIGSPLDRAMPYPRYFHCYPRRFYDFRFLGPALPPKESPGVLISPWTEQRQDDSARLIARSYAGHIDSHINDQYRSAAGARRFLTNIVQYPGCGSFSQPASFVAMERGSRTVCGISLASMVAQQVGHITQLCVGPEQRGTGLGYELLRRSLMALSEQGARTVSLTVTSANTPAIRVYEQMGFTPRREFAAYVWER